MRRFDTVELNASFYRWPRTATSELVAARVGEWAGTGQDVLVYFNDDGYGHAVRNAERLRALTGS